MTSKERKIVRLKKLVSDINTDLLAVDRIAVQIQSLAGEIDRKSGPVDEREMMLMAAYLHHFYTGLEAVFERISSDFDGGIGARGDYHRELLRSMTIVIDGVRPEVISKDLAEELDDYRKFRHLFRQAYAGELCWKKMSHLAVNTREIYNVLEKSLHLFREFIKRIIMKLENSVKG